MADAPRVEVYFDEANPARTRRIVVGLPDSLPEMGDDFDFKARDYDGIRIFMLEELAARVPERLRWTPADIEVVLVEAFAAVLDQLSDMADRVAAEAWLETARRPASVRRLLRFIGHDAVQIAFAKGWISEPTEGVLEALWQSKPWLMEQARIEGPRGIRESSRMVTLEDYRQKLEEHPLVLRASATLAWNGSWFVVRVAVIPWSGSRRKLDTPGIDRALHNAVEQFHVLHGAVKPQWDEQTTLREVLVGYLEACRMIGQEVELVDAIPVGIDMSLVVRIQNGYFQSEVRLMIERALDSGPGGFFEPGRLRFGEDLFMSDVITTLTAIEGIQGVSLDRFKRFGDQHPNEALATGRIVLSGIEIAVCDNDDTRLERGTYKLELIGGRRG